MSQTTTLKEARDILRNAVLYLGSSTYEDNRKIDYAIRVACQRFLRETGLDRTVATAPTVADTQTIDVAASISDFLPGTLVAPPWIEASDTWLSTAALKDVVDLRNQSAASGEPEVIAWASVSGALAHLYPTPDAVYTISFYYKQPLVSFTIGTGNPGGTTLNVEDRYIDEVMHTGGKAYMLMGAVHTHKDAPDAMREFERLLLRAKSEVLPPTVRRGHWTAGFGREYDNQSRI